MVHDTGLSGSAGVSGMWIWEVGRGVWWGVGPSALCPCPRGAACAREGRSHTLRPCKPVRARARGLCCPGAEGAVGAKGVREAPGVLTRPKGALPVCPVLFGLLSSDWGHGPAVSCGRVPWVGSTHSSVTASGNGWPPSQRLLFGFPRAGSGARGPHAHETHLLSHLQVDKLGALGHSHNPHPRCSVPEHFSHPPAVRFWGYFVVI